MTPKEKATELVDLFDRLLPTEGLTTNQTPIDCALICVNEILKSSVEAMYWLAVKKELNSL